LKNLLMEQEFFKRTPTFKAVKISIASPEKIRSWSHGEVKKAETLNYRTLKPERDGLFCARIFGPIKDHECLCGRYKRMKYRGIECEKCGVEVISSKVRRERMGHIELASPVAHIWFFKTIPSKLCAILGKTVNEVERVLYFQNYIVIDPGKTKLEKGQILKEQEYEEYVKKYGADAFKAGMGAEAIREILKDVNLEELAQQISKQIKSTSSEGARKKLLQRLKIVNAFIKSGTRPEWMILEVLPVLPPDLRPLVPLEGGRFASSDLNELYRRIINRNNRLKKLMELGAPEIIIRNEKRMLQEAVDALFENGKRGKPVTGSHGRVLKSLTDMIKGKQGRFRQNLLGKRVDYSGRSVIVVGPNLKLHQCGLPKIMALELFKPFIFQKLEEKGITSSLKESKQKVERGDKEVWDVLEEVTREHLVLLNRAPTLHRVSIEAFEPVLVEGKAIQIHPLVCPPYNADFDGDQMAVHLPLSIPAQVEARTLLLSTNNMLSPAHGKPLMVPTQDIVLGLYYLTKEKPYDKGEGLIFSDPKEAIYAWNSGKVGLHAKIKVRINEELVETTVGRLILYDVVPKEIPFEYVNRLMKKKVISELIEISYRKLGPKSTAILCDKLKDLGFEFATRSGASFNIDDVIIPQKKKELIKKANEEVEDILRKYEAGYLSSSEKSQQLGDIWTAVTKRVSAEMINELSKMKVKTPDGKEVFVSSFNPIFMMVDSGARGSERQAAQLGGMRGLMAKPSGDIIDTPITSNFREGLSMLEYFISTHGARKGLADTALRTSHAGYLTRKMVDVAQDVVVKEYDCGTLDGIEMSALIEGGNVIESLAQRIIGRVALFDITDPLTGELIVKGGEAIDEEIAKKIEDAGLDKVTIRSVLTCKTKRGVCALCYGWDLSKREIVDIGEAVGIIAAQSIGEPGTQLTMRTFHLGGVASKVTEQSSIRARNSGIVKFQNLKFVINKEGKKVVMNRNGRLNIIVDGREKESYRIPYGATLFVDDGGSVNSEQVLAEWNVYYEPIITDVDGIVEFRDIELGLTMEERINPDTGYQERVIIESGHSELTPRIHIKDEHGETKKRPGTNELARFTLSNRVILNVKEGDRVYPGDIIARKPRETMKTKDITGGLPRVAELFEARAPKDEAVITEIDGRVEKIIEEKGRRKIIINPEVKGGKIREYIIPKGKYITVREGDWVEAGEELTDGSPDPAKVLAVKGEKGLAQFLVDEVQQVYNLQGVTINSKHIEIIVRQMLKKVRIKDPGDSEFLPGDLVDKEVVEEENERLEKENKKRIEFEFALLGITQAALNTESWISAASFQETTRVLTRAAIAGKKDMLRGLKENVIMGKMIPAGTGFPDFQDYTIELELPREEEAVRLLEEE